MLFASDFEDNRVHIDDTHSNQEYYCPYCGAPLVTKKGDIRQHHFAHKQSHVCSDTWANGGSMVMIFHHGTMSGNPSFPR